MTSHNEASAISVNVRGVDVGPGALLARTQDADREVEDADREVEDADREDEDADNAQ